MAKTILSPKRLAATKKLHIGRIIVFCEGYTERNYIQYFADIINSRDDKYNDIRVELEIAGGNSQAVLNYANTFLQNEYNNKKYSIYKKYLVFDCDAPKEIQPVIVSASKCNNPLRSYTFLLSI